jgi:hypothetical protein
MADELANVLPLCHHICRIRTIFESSRGLDQRRDPKNALRDRSAFFTSRQLMHFCAAAVFLPASHACASRLP